MKTSETSIRELARSLGYSAEKVIQIAHMSNAEFCDEIHELNQLRDMLKRYRLIYAEQMTTILISEISAI